MNTFFFIVTFNMILNVFNLDLFLFHFFIFLSNIVFFINKTPKKIVKVNLGNISNPELIKIISENIQKIEQLSQNHKNFIIEIDLEFTNFITLD